MKVGRTIPILLVAFAGTVTVRAQEPAAPPPAAQKMEMPGKPGMMEESMMAHHKEMMAKMEAMDARLDELVKSMNAAKGRMMKGMEDSMARCPMMKGMAPTQDGQ